MLGSERGSYVQLLEFTPANRLAVERAIEGLVDLLDAFDAPEEDLEPWLGRQEAGAPLDAEDEHDGREPDDDPGEDDGTAEPGLGAPERHPEPPPLGFTRAFGPYHDSSRAADQTRWASGSGDDREAEDEHDEDGADREQEHDGREPDVDDEPEHG